MFQKRFVFNIVGKKDLVDKASVEIQSIISTLTNEPVDIIMENQSTIYNSIRLNNKDARRLNVNKCYIDDSHDSRKLHSDKITDLSRHIRSISYDTVHPWNLHVDDVDELYVSEFMKACSQINCVYPINASVDDKIKHIEVFFNH